MNFALEEMRMNDEKGYEEIKEISEYIRLDSKRYDHELSGEEA